MDYTKSAEYQVFDIEDIFDLREKDDVKDKGEKFCPKTEEILNKIEKLQKGKTLLENELKQVYSLYNILQKEENELNAETSKLEEAYSKKDETCKILRFTINESETEFNRQIQLNEKLKDMIQENTFQIQAAKLKKRKQRLEFENQLEQLIDQLKHINAAYVSQTLSEELKYIENNNIHLLNTEQVKKKQLAALKEEMNGMEPAKTDQSGKSFLYSFEAAVA
uniref:Uncharacterized protein n=1 Tax=Erpetoichthys calabaricus TaxID=27687 RepID=A0A8C4SCY0_ERPCA